MTNGINKGRFQTVIGGFLYNFSPHLLFGNIVRILIKSLHPPAITRSTGIKNRVSSAKNFTSNHHIIRVIHISCPCKKHWERIKLGAKQKEKRESEKAQTGWLTQLDKLPISLFLFIICSLLNQKRPDSLAPEQSLKQRWHSLL